MNPQQYLISFHHNWCRCLGYCDAHYFWRNLRIPVQLSARIHHGRTDTRGWGHAAITLHAPRGPA